MMIESLRKWKGRQKEIEVNWWAVEKQWTDNKNGWESVSSELLAWEWIKGQVQNKLISTMNIFIIAANK